MTSTSRWFPGRLQVNWRWIFPPHSFVFRFLFFCCLGTDCTRKALFMDKLASLHVELSAVLSFVVVMSTSLVSLLEEAVVTSLVVFLVESLIYLVPRWPVKVARSCSVLTLVCVATDLISSFLLFAGGGGSCRGRSVLPGAYSACCCCLRLLLQDRTRGLLGRSWCCVAQDSLVH